MLQDAESGAEGDGERASPAHVPASLTAQARAIRSTRTSVSFDPLLAYETWRGLGAKMGMYSNATAWWLGDWLVFGRMKYGRRYKQAIADTGLDYQTLRNYAMVARRFAPARRRAELSFGHHAEACALPDEAQEEWLARAVAHGWSRNEFRRRLRVARLAGGSPADVLRVTIEGAHAGEWRRAAERREMSLAEWIVVVLDRAAEEAEDRERPARARSRGPSAREAVPVQPERAGQAATGAGVSGVPAAASRGGSLAHAAPSQCSP